MDTKKGHTPGPWEVYKDTNGKYGIKNILGGYGGHAELSKADAALIAAAPELLEALIECMDFIHENGFPIHPRHREIRDKAEGR